MEFMDTILTRQSCRDYAPEQIDQRQLGEILRAGCAAPIGRKKFETVQLTVIQDPALLELITQNAKKVLNDPDANPLYGAPTMILVSVKEQEGQIPPTGIANAACVVENMHLAATDLGLGSCYLWGVVQTMSQSLDIMYKLGLQEGFWPVSAVAVGHSRTHLEKREVPLKKLVTNFIG